MYIMKDLSLKYNITYLDCSHDERLVCERSAAPVKARTKVKNIRLTDGDHNIACKIDSFGSMGLKSEFVKNAMVSIIPFLFSFGAISETARIFTSEDSDIVQNKAALIRISLLLTV